MAQHYLRLSGFLTLEVIAYVELANFSRQPNPKFSDDLLSTKHRILANNQYLMNSLPWTWIFWAVVCLIAIRLLLSHVYTLRDHLRDLLLEHFRNQMELAKKRQNILRMQAKIRERNQRAEAERLEREKTNQSVETSRKRAA